MHGHWQNSWEELTEIGTYALDFLLKNKYLVIEKADKGNKVVILNRKDNVW